MITTPVHELATDWDVVVIGSGAAGLTAAVRAADGGARVLVLEKAELLGGTTAAGGGVVWAPANAIGAAAGYGDSREQAADYLRAAAGDRMSSDEIDAYVDTAPRAVDYLVSSTRVSFTALARPDYHLEWPGAVAGGRSLDNDAFDPSGIPGLAESVRPSSYFPRLTMAERDDLDGRAPDPALVAGREAAGVRTMGGALVLSLLASALDRGVRVAVGARVTGLERDDAADPADDRAGWTVRIGDRVLRARAVVLASGGFEWSPDLQRAFLAHPITPISAPSDEGDGLRLGLAVGAAVDEMTSFWGVPVITPPGQTYDGVPSGRMGNVEMTLPGSITVNRRGRRFVNEALNYHDVSRVFGAVDPATLGPANDPAWLVVDRRYLDTYPIAGSTPGVPEPWMTEAPTVGALAEAIGVDPAGLVDQVERFNAGARVGEDPEFGRGASAQDRFLGDAANGPNPCLRPLEEGPFYAVPVRCGTLGTSGGVATDAHGRALGHDGAPIPGLYAAGNVAASVFRDTYPGGGATLGSAVVRAFAAGEHLAATCRPVAELDARSSA